MKQSLSLNKITKGSIITIHSLPPGTMRIQLIRMGISVGETVTCIERLPGGTIVILKSRQEIAIGSELAKKILVILN